MIRFALSFVAQRIPERPAGYYQDVLSMGTVFGEEIEFTDEAYQALCAKYGTPVVYTLVQKFENFANTVGEWVKHGFPGVSEETFKERLRICGECIHWKGLVADKCEICGCYQLKHEMATATCPIKKWLPVRKS